MLDLNSLPVAKKLGLIIGSAVLGVMVIAAVFLASERRLILDERQSAVRQAVEVAYGLVDHFHQQVATGSMTEDDAKQRAIAAIQALRYSGEEYFWINDMQPAMVMHPMKPELVGKDLTDTRDPTGKRLFVEFSNTAKGGGSGFVFYSWPKPGSDRPVPKVSYVKGFEPWGWVIGSGVYIDTVNATIVRRIFAFSAGSLLLAAVLLAIGLLIARSLLRQLGGEPGYATEVTHRMAAGDLSLDIELRRQDRSSLLYSIKSMRDGFASIVGRVREGSESVATATQQIAQGNRDLSRRTETEAAALEQTAAAMEQLSSTVRLNADNAKLANQSARNASSIAMKGGEVVGQAVEKMQGLRDSSRKISDIIGVIDGIAFQTNILALNAAVEAARAGEQGRGFAVVASEVRHLAGRAATAAKEIAGLINDSVQRVEDGTALVGAAGATMTEVVHAIQRVTDVMADITAASAEQSEGVSQVGVAVTQIDQTTQQNAALVEQSTAATESLRRQAQQLLEAVTAFKLPSA